MIAPTIKSNSNGIINSESIDYYTNPGAFYISAIINDHFEHKDQIVYLETTMKFDQCFQLAKEGKLHEATIVYAQCLEIIKNITPKLAKWIMAFFGQRLCYYHFKCRNYTEGIRLSQQIMQTVQGLENEGFKYLFFVNIQQRINMSKIQFESDNKQTALKVLANCITEIYDRSKNNESKSLINGVKESVLFKISEYGMIVEILSSTCNKILRMDKEDDVEIDKSIRMFIEPLENIRFALMSTDAKYESIEKFVSLMSSICGSQEFNDGDILYYFQNKHADKKLRNVLSNYINHFSSN